MKNEREEIIQRLKEYAQLPGSGKIFSALDLECYPLTLLRLILTYIQGSLMDLLKCAMDDRSKQCRSLQSQLK